MLSIKEAVLFPEEISRSIAHCADYADRLVRGDLSQGVIANENDYTSNFTAALRREVTGRNIKGLKATSFVLPSSGEQKVGADAAIVLANNTHFKVGLFEAKWPRLSTHKNYWDSIQKSSGTSHFDDQLKRQSKVADRFAVWEMFYCELALEEKTAFFPDFGSACIWHDDAINFSKERNVATPWTDNLLSEMLLEHNMGIFDVFYDICICKKGKPFGGRDYEKVFTETGNPKIREVLLIMHDNEMLKSDNLL